jgi:hypothetical protein
MRVTIPDDVADQIAEQLQGRRTLDEDVTRRLQQTLAAGPGDVRLVLGGSQLLALGEALGTDIPIRTFERLLTLAERLAQLHLGHVRLQWTPEQLALLTARAERSGLSVEHLVAGVASRLLSEVFLVPPLENAPALCIERLVVPVERPPADVRANPRRSPRATRTAAAGVSA